ncbi:hypothetical protein DFQ14_11297 [Halopolyspora algeriensis]|uniref:Uncharacterized protein n=1 Tax=Halopolyspora algeriensis TaxID=1500506 RepID=A0A368VFZ8_9ACTN|nr:hypothetical protein [Halopolyspora algeriensis]RCW40216.1 hypothetical protein DFQ14_11297 [Halopolyspora algeriensis]TQM46303.1 hypothetical protein FHU43_3974 [Halopolyspora algeriensis]
MADPGERAWMASVHESGWHAVARCSCGGSVITACGHRLHGPVHRRLGDEPPQDTVRTVCAPCAQLAGVVPPRLPRVSPRIAWPARDPDIDWPDEDSDAETTGRRPALNLALATIIEHTPPPGNEQPDERAIAAKALHPAA